MENSRCLYSGAAQLGNSLKQRPKRGWEEQLALAGFGEVMQTDSSVLYLANLCVAEPSPAQAFMYRARATPHRSLGSTSLAAAELAAS